MLWVIYGHIVSYPTMQSIGEHPNSLTRDSSFMRCEQPGFWPTARFAYESWSILSHRSSLDKMVHDHWFPIPMLMTNECVFFILLSMFELCRICKGKTSLWIWYNIILEICLCNMFEYVKLCFPNIFADFWNPGRSSAWHCWCLGALPICTWSLVTIWTKFDW